MKTLKVSVAAFLLAVGLVPAGAAIASTGQAAETTKPTQLAQFYRGGGYWVCYNRVRVVGWRHWHGKYRHYRGVRNVCGIYRTPCRAYGKYTYGRYLHPRHARQAAYQCSRYWR